MEQGSLARRSGDQAIKDNLAERMGHKHIETTFKHYVDTAILIHAEVQGGANLGQWFPDQAKYLDEVYEARTARR